MTARLTRLVLPDAGTDADLLARFVATRDDGAFAELVRRHGPAVLAACRRITHRTPDAEDAFQATFLVLARKAHQVRPGEPVGAWLYGVAVRAARKAATRAFRRHDRETLVAAVPDVPERAAEPFDPDAARAVAEEVGRLSPKYRAAVVLCELEGRPRAAAARELGIAEGTLSSRLAAARKQLAERLAARGFGPAALAALAPAAVSPALSAAAAALPGGPAPVGVAALSRGALHPMFFRKIQLAALAIGVVASAALAAGLLAAPPAPDPTAPAGGGVPVAPPAPKVLPNPPPKGPNRILITKNGRLMLIDPDGKNASPVTTDGESPRSGRLSPDGRTVAYVAHLMDVPPAPEGIRQIEQRLFVRRADGTGAATDLGVAAESFAWSADGSRIATTDFVKRGGELTAVHKLVDVAVKTAADLPVPADHILTDWSRDGRFFLTQQFRPSDPEGVLPTIRIRLLNRDGTDDKLTNAATRLLLNGRLSPDGRRVLCEQARLPPDPTGKWPPRRPVVLDLVTGVVTSLADFPPNGEMFGFCWSPDGRRVAFAWHPAGDIDPTLPPLESSLVVCDADGRNSATVATAKGLLPIGSALLVEDWR